MIYHPNPGTSEGGRGSLSNAAGTAGTNQDCSRCTGTYGHPDLIHSPTGWLALHLVGRELS